MKIKLSDQIIVIIVFIIIVTFIFINIFSRRSEYLLMDYISMKSTNIINAIINKSIVNILYEQKCDNLIKDYKDENGNIVNLDFNNNIVNRMIYLITEDILDDMNNIESSDFNNINSKYINKNNRVQYVPLGIIYNTPLLNNLGPKIPFKIEFLGSVNNEAKINIKEYGINSSLVELVINLNLQVQIILPFKSKAISIDKSVILDSKIIQGKVPSYYGGLISGSLK